MGATTIARQLQQPQHTAVCEGKDERKRKAKHKREEYFYLTNMSWSFGHNFYSAACRSILFSSCRNNQNILPLKGKQNGYPFNL